MELKGTSDSRQFSHKNRKYQFGVYDGPLTDNNETLVIIFARNIQTLL